MKKKEKKKKGEERKIHDTVAAFDLNLICMFSTTYHTIHSLR